jgi:hypothetical protein
MLHLDDLGAERGGQVAAKGWASEGAGGEDLEVLQRAEGLGDEMAFSGLVLNFPGHAILLGGVAGAKTRRVAKKAATNLC